jgi:hypothetical protein
MYTLKIHFKLTSQMGNQRQKEIYYITLINSLEILELRVKMHC